MWGVCAYWKKEQNESKLFSQDPQRKQGVSTRGNSYQGYFYLIFLYFALPFSSCIRTVNVPVGKQLLKICVMQGVTISNAGLMGRTYIPSASQVLLLLRRVKADIPSQAVIGWRKIVAPSITRITRSNIMTMMVHNIWQTIVKCIRKGSPGKFHSIKPILWTAFWVWCGYKKSLRHFHITSD